MPNRIIKESICFSESIKGLSWFEEVFFYRLIVNADDYGRLDGRTEMLQARLFPLRRDIAEKVIDKALNALTTAGMVQTYECDGHPFLQLTAWERHQQIRAKKSKFPDPPPLSISCNQMISDVPVIQSESESESESEANSSTRSKKFIPPTLEEVTAYCKERGNAVDPKRFYDYFNASDWVDSAGKPVRNWKQKVITWESHTNSKGGTTDEHNQHGGSADGTTTKWGNLSTRILG